MKKTVFSIAMAICVAMSMSSAKADVVFGFGDLPLGPDEFGPTIAMDVDLPILGFDVAFDYPDSGDGSWSSDYYAIIVDPSGDVIGLGDGLGDGDIDYIDGVATGVDGAQNDTPVGGSYGTFFDISLLQAISPTFGEAGEYTVQFADGWGGGTNVETLGNATVTVSTVPEPTSAALIGLSILGLAVRRRR